MSGLPLLSLSIWIPIVTGILVMAMGGGRSASSIRIVASIGAVAAFLVTVPLYLGFDLNTAAMQFVEVRSWIPRFNVNYHLGVDGLSLLFILFNGLLTVLIILVGGRGTQENLAQYLAGFLVIGGAINGVFAAVDALLFYMFFEFSIIPMALLIGIWGGPKRVEAANRFVVFNLCGSLLLLLSFLYLSIEAGGSFSILDWHLVPLAMTPQILIFMSFFIAFGVKVPMWPMHSWLPGAQAVAPTGVALLMTAIFLKLGCYGFIRFSLPVTPDASQLLSWLMVAFSLIAMAGFGFFALRQGDMRKRVAYSSISSMGFVTLGFFLFETQGIEGALLQMTSHGFISAALLICIGFMFERVGSSNVSDYTGVGKTMPRFAALVVLFMLANVGLPATSGFVGGFMITRAAVDVTPWGAALAAIVLVVGVAYTLWTLPRLIFVREASHHVGRLADVEGRELVVLVVLAIGVLSMGVIPSAFTEVMHVSVDDLVRHVAKGKL